MPQLLSYQTRVLLFVSKIKTTGNKDLCGSEPGYLRPKRYDLYFCYFERLGQYILRGFSESNPANLRQWSQQARKRKRKKRKKDIKKREKQNFLPLGALARSSEKVFIEGNSLFLTCQFLRQQQTYMMEWLRDKAMLLRLTTLRYFLSRKEQESVVFVKEEFLLQKIQKKEDVFGYLTTNSPRKVV